MLPLQRGLILRFFVSVAAIKAKGKFFSRVRDRWKLLRPIYSTTILHSCLMKEAVFSFRKAFLSGCLRETSHLLGFQKLLSYLKKASGTRRNMKRTGDTFLKPGSHMPPSCLRHNCRYCLRYRSDKRTEAEVMSVLSAGTPGKLTRVQLRRLAGGKDLRCFLLLAALCPHLSG